MCYQYDEGVEECLEEALKWYELAASNGDTHAKEALKGLLSR
jgi:TPR repeat protein